MPGIFYHLKVTKGFYFYICTSRRQRLGTAEPQGKLCPLQKVAKLWQFYLNAKLRRLCYINWGCKYDGTQMHDKWQGSDPRCLFVLARVFSPTTFKWFRRSLRFKNRMQMIITPTRLRQHQLVLRGIEGIGVKFSF